MEMGPGSAPGQRTADQFFKLRHCPTPCKSVPKRLDCDRQNREGPAREHDAGRQASRPRTGKCRVAATARCLPCRTQRSARTADRDRRGVAGHQFLARRPRPGVRRDGGKGARALCDAASGDACGSTTATHFPAAAMRGFSEPMRRGAAAGTARERTIRADACSAAERCRPLRRSGGHFDDPVLREGARPISAASRTILYVALRKDGDAAWRSSPSTARKYAHFRTSRSRCCRTSRRRRSSRWRTRGS